LTRRVWAGWSASWGSSRAQWWRSRTTGEHAERGRVSLMQPRQPRPSWVLFQGTIRGLWDG
jgi:hypothetical protein